VTFAAAIRPDDWDLPLFLHVFGAMLLVGTLVTAAWFLFAARRDNSLDGVRWGWRTLLFAALPSYILMRVGADWITDKEHLGDSDAAWINIGFITGDAGALLLIVALVAAGIAVRRAGRAQAAAVASGAGGAGTGTGTGVAIAAWATALLIVMYIVAIWAMTTKPI
jgi:hypothetical protein